jgi:nicotinate-nucleotide adenylyltransferase
MATLRGRLQWRPVTPGSVAEPSCQRLLDTGVMVASYPHHMDAEGSGAKRIGVMGGTFDPIHHGHLVAASEVGHFFSLDEVVFVPTGQPWQKDGRVVSEAEDRYLMTVIATASNPRFSVSRVDIDRPGPTYTIDTLRELRAIRGLKTELFFITGADAMEQLMSWRDADELFQLAHFVGCTRPGHRLSGAGLPDERVSLIEIPALTISSTACRERVVTGEPIWYLVPDGIVQYIAKRGLYQRRDR